MAHALGLPCIAVDTLEATATGIEQAEAVVCPIQDARVQQVYGAAFRNGERLMQDCALKLEEYLEALSAFEGPYLFTGDGIIPYREHIAQTLGEKARFAAAHNAYLRPAAVAALAARDVDRAVDYLTLQPMYLRAPQAERARALREAGHE